jgi:hypothetical protein
VKPKDDLADKRAKLLDLMREAGKDSPTLENDIRRLDPGWLERLLEHYSADASPRCVW